MAYDEKLAERVRRVLPLTIAISERKMFGGIAFLLDGKMFIGVTANDLMVRVGAPGYEAALAKRHVRPMDFTGKPLTGFVYVAATGSRTEAAVAGWVETALAFVRTVPTKPRKPRPGRSGVGKRRPTRRGGTTRNASRRGRPG